MKYKNPIQNSNTVQWGSKQVFRVACASLGVLGLSSIAAAQTPPNNPAPVNSNLPAGPAANEGVSTISGVVSQYLINPDGDVDGLLLADHSIVKFPPHLSESLVRVVKPQQMIRAQGNLETTGVLHATQIVNSGSQQTVTDTPPAAMNRGPNEAAARQSLSFSGTIQVLLHGPRGEVNGVVLDNGAEVRVPGRVAEQFANLLQIGSPLAASGDGTVNGYGRCLDAESIGSSSGAMQTVADVGGPRGGRKGR